MMIAVSGMVGAGKSTAVNHAVRVLHGAGAAATASRFQTLPCFSLLRPRPGPTHRGTAREPDASPRQATRARWAGYRRRRLSAALATVYMARIIAFRAYRLFWRRGEARVLNRYFYDLFVHLRLTGWAERRYYALLRAMVPVPDLAVLVTARPDTIGARRPTYAEEYLAEVAAAYGRLRADFPELVEVRTDPGEHGLEEIAQLLVARITEASGAAR
jgi:hypothetical protein